MADFATELENVCAALQTAGYEAPETFSALTVNVGKATALAVAKELLSRARSGSSDMEVMAAFPFALAFIVNVFVYCTKSRGNAIVVNRLMEAATKIAHSLGDGDIERLRSRRNTSLNCL